MYGQAHYEPGHTDEVGGYRHRPPRGSSQASTTPASRHHGPARADTFPPVRQQTMTPPHQGVTPRVLIETEEAALALWRAGCRDGRPSDAVARPLTSTLTTTRCHRVGRARTTPDRLTSTRSPHGRPTLHLESERPRGTGGSNPSASAALTSRNTDLARSPRCRPCWRGLSWHPQQSCPDMEGGLSSGHGEAVSTTVAVDTASVDRMVRW